MKFIRRVDKTNYLENQEISITLGAGGGTDTDTIENLLIGTDLEALEFEIEGKRYVFLGFITKD